MTEHESISPELKHESVSASDSSPSLSDGSRERGDRPHREKKQFFKRRRICPFAGENAPTIDYKDVRLLMKFVSERGKLMPSRITAVSLRKQKELAVAVKRARYLALMPFVNKQ
jgi:small subunit ribosomal protein S18